MKTANNFKRVLVAANYKMQDERRCTSMVPWTPLGDQWARCRQTRTLNPRRQTRETRAPCRRGTGRNDILASSEVWELRAQTVDQDPTTLAAIVPAHSTPYTSHIMSTISCQTHPTSLSDWPQGTTEDRSVWRYWRGPEENLRHGM